MDFGFYKFLTTSIYLIYKNLYIFQMKLFTVRHKGRETKGQTGTRHFTETPHNITL